MHWDHICISFPLSTTIVAITILSVDYVSLTICQVYTITMNLSQLRLRDMSSMPMVTQPVRGEIKADIQAITLLRSNSVYSLERAMHSIWRD